MAIYYPVYLNLQGRKCLIAGGGQVALRKAAALLEHGAEITVISPRICAGLRKLESEGMIKAVNRYYRAGDMKGVSIAIVATSNRKINRSAAEEAKKRRVPVNVVDDPMLSDFIVPSILRRGDLSIAVSTSAKSPALARKIRSRLEGAFGSEYASLVTLIEKVRRRVKKQGLKVSSSDWQRTIDIDSMIALIREGRVEEAEQDLIEKLRKCAK
ncbi:MAG: bifunctional precorrin-2 dehydrogenase/sirohydrochlorin ferrochelatase [Dehalococcoidia bacterium]|jgi:siroheme synthase (precorrin-2 oxidase/ferrochelatase)